jgi:hypothetical protein
MLALWLYATIEGVGSARELERLAQSDAAYRWLAGGAPLTYHGLADFRVDSVRVDSVEVLDRLLTQSVTALIAGGLISLDEIAVDGTKMRARASKESFKTGEKLIKIEAAVGLSGWPFSSRSFRAIRGPRCVGDKPRASAPRVMFRRAREERGRRGSAHRTKPGRKSPRLRRPIPRRATCAFPTAPFAPPTTLKIAGAPKEGVIVTIAVTDRRNDAGLAEPMVDDIVRRYGRTPERLLVQLRH